MEVRGNLLDFFRMHPWPSGTAWDYHIPFSLEAALSSDNFISVKRAINDVASHSGTKQDDIVISIARETPDHVSQRRPSAWNQHPDSKESYPISFPWASRAPSIRPGMDGRISGQRSRPPMSICVPRVHLEDISDDNMGEDEPSPREPASGQTAAGPLAPGPLAAGPPTGAPST